MPKERLITLLLAFVLVGGFFAVKQAYAVYTRHNLQHELAEKNFAIIKAWGAKVDKDLEALKGKQ